ncbi:MFS transporter [uncultured Eubacterium sp.]|uniref:MFS transporter n=1 Tax=uncultured Eubacterium sp. TaxID=165185 RepID=UPI0015BEFD39|nr:MFS transporter [uncultured Eubacterium sp.]
MNLSITIDWKFAVALGSTAVGVIFAVKMDSTAIERVLANVADTYKEYAIAKNGSC